MRKTYMELGDRRNLTGSSIDRRAPYTKVMRGESPAFAHHVLDGLLKVWSGWRSAEGQKDEVARNLAAAFIARTLGPILTEINSDPTAAAFVTFLGETLTTQEHAIQMQARRLAGVVSGITASGNAQLSPIAILDETAKRGDEGQTTEVLYQTFQALGLGEILENAPAVEHQFQDDNSVGRRRTVALGGSDGAYKLVWDMHDRTNRQVLTLQTAGAPESYPPVDRSLLPEI